MAPRVLFPVVVIGAGPAGLATSHELHDAGIEHVVLERGQQVGETWANLYDSLVLHTARGLSSLPGLKFPAETPRFPSRQDFLRYLHRYRDAFHLPISTGSEVTRLRRENGTWVATTSAGVQISARVAVVASGIVANPVSPEIPNRLRFVGRVMHSVEYRRPDALASQRVLVVGAGNSAGEIAAELAHAGAEVTIAVRSGAVVVPREVAGIPIQYLAVSLSRLPKSVQRSIARVFSLVSGMFHGPAVLPRPPGDSACRQVPLIGFHLTDGIRQGRIRLQPGLSEFTSEGVRFTNGTSQAFDTVIFATGFRAALHMLGPAVRRDSCGFALRKDGVTSADDERLLFVGHNYDLRGGLLNIGRDAGLAARRIAAALSARDTSRTSTEMPRRSSGK